MQLFIQIITIIGAYLLGSIPTSVWIGKVFYGIDVREHGSGNPGATNTFRVLGVKAGIPVLLFDVLKGFAAVKMVILTNFYLQNTSPYINYELFLGIAATLGHIFPVFARFRGGKGVATLLGVVVALHPVAALISIGIFLVSFLLTRFVSLSSIIAGFSFPILIIVFFKTTIVSLCIFSLIIAIIILFTHQKNIERLLKREENKANIFRKKLKE